MGTTRTSPRILLHLLPALVLSLIGIVAVFPASALALAGRPATSTFGSFSHAAGIAVDQSSGNVYVTDGGGDEEVQVFGPEGGSPLGGGPSSFTGMATPSKSFLFSFEQTGPAAAGGDVYVADVDHGVIDKFSLNGLHEYEFVCEISGFGAGGPACLSGVGSGTGFSEPLGVALDSAGDLYISNYGSSAIYEYNPAGEEIASFESGLLGEPQYVAVDATGDVYAQGYGSHQLIEFERSSLTASTVEETIQVATGATGVAVDDATGDVLVDLGSSAEELDASHNVVGTFGAGIIKEGAGIAVNEASGVVSVISHGVVQQFGPISLDPTVTACSASSVTPTTATLQGTVNPEGAATTYQFEYGLSPNYGSLTPEPAASAGSAVKAEPVTATLKGLAPETTYDCRIKAKNNGSPVGEETGPSGTFTTPPAVTGVRTNAASNVTFEGATLNGALRPEGTAAGYFFEYGTGTSYGHSTTTVTSSSTEASASAAVLKLIPSTTYHYRLVAKRTIEGKIYEVFGKDEVVTTGGVAPEVQSEVTSTVTPFSATLEATINPGNSATSYYFVYGTSPTSEQAVMPSAIASGYGSIQVNPRVLQALQPDTTYYYHVVAENTFGKVEGVEGPSGPEEKTFTTLPAFAPEVSLGAVTEVGGNTASVSTTIDANGLATEYEIELGVAGAYTPVTVQSAGEATVAETLSYALSGLAPGTSYQLRVVAWNQVGETTSAVRSFTTAASSALVFAQPVTPVLVAFTSIAIPAEEPTTATTKPKSLTRAQKLKAALKACGKKKPKSKRASCEKQARKKYAHRLTRRGTRPAAR